MDGSSHIFGALRSSSLWRHTGRRLSSTARIPTAHFCQRDLHHLPLIVLCLPSANLKCLVWFFPEKHPCTGYEPKSAQSFSGGVAGYSNLDNSQFGYGPITQNPLWKSTRDFAETANAHNCRSLLAERHVDWQEHGRSALNYQQASFERAAQEYEQAAQDEVHVVPKNPERKCGKNECSANHIVERRRVGQLVQ